MEAPGVSMLGGRKVSVKLIDREEMEFDQLRASNRASTDIASTRDAP